MKTLTVGLATLAVSLAATGAAFADSAPIPSAPGAASVENTPISDLLTNPAEKAVLDKDMPGLTTDPRLEMVKSMTLRGLEAFPEAKLDDVKLAAMQKDFDAVKKP